MSCGRVTQLQKSRLRRRTFEQHLTQYVRNFLIFVAYFWTSNAKLEFTCIKITNYLKDEKRSYGY